MKKLFFFLICFPCLAFSQADTVVTLKSSNEPADDFTAGLGFGQNLSGFK